MKHQRPLGSLSNFLLKKICHYPFSGNIWPLVIGTSSCSLEFLAAWQECKSFRSPHSLHLFTPEEADILIVYGHVNRSMFQLVLDIYHRMPSSKKVLLVGACAMKSDLFEDSYWGGCQLADSLNVDVSVQGDPPSKDDILEGFREISQIYHMELQKR